MANGADGSITIDTALDTGGFQRGSKELDKAIKGLNSTVISVGDNMRSAVQSMNTALQSMGSAAQENGSKFQEFLDTRDFDKAMDSLQKQTQGLVGDLAKIGSAESNGIKPGAQFEQLERQIEKTEQALHSLKDKMDQFGSITIETPELKALMEEYRASKKALDDAVEQTMSKDGGDLGLPGHEEFQKAVEEARLDFEWIQQAVADLEQNGGITSNADTEEYQQLEETYYRMTEALQTYKQALQEAKTNRIEEIQSLQNERAAALQTESAERQQAEALKTVEQPAIGVSDVLKRITSSAAQAAAGLARLTWRGITAGLQATISAVGQLGSALVRVGQTAARIAGSIGSAMGRIASSAAQTAVSIGKLGLKGMANGAKLAAKGIGSLVTRLKELMSHNSKATLSSNGLVKALSSFKRMLITRIKRTFISTVFKDLQSGLHDFAKYSSTFNAAMSNMKNSMTALSGNIGVLAGSLIETLAPALVTIIDWLSQAMTYFNAFMSLLSGKSTYTVAKKGTADYAAGLDKTKKSANKAQGAVQDLEKEVYGFDELNKASSRNASGGGSGADADDVEDSIQFTEKALASLPKGLQDFMNSLKNAFNAGEFRKVGELLGTGLNTIVTTVDKWITEKLRPAAIIWTARITGVLNGLIGSFDWENLGKLVGDGFNTLLSVANEFVSTLDFEALGKGLADALNGLTTTVDWPKLGKTIYRGIRGLYNVTVVALGLYNWTELGKGLGEALNNLIKDADWEAAKEKAKAASEGIADGINALSSTIHWRQLGQSFSQGCNLLVWRINYFVKRLNLTQIASDIADGINGFFSGVEWNTLGTTVGTGLTDIVSAFTTFANDTEWETIGAGIGEAISSLTDAIDFTEVTANAESAGKRVAKGINSLSTSIHWGWIGVKIAAGANVVIGALKSFVTELDAITITTNLAEAINNVVGGVEWASLGETVGTASSKIITGITNLETNINWETIGTSISAGVNSITENLDLTAAIESAESAGSRIAAGINSLTSSIKWKLLGNLLAMGFNMLVLKVKGFITNLDLESIKASVTEGLNGLLDGVNWETLGETVGLGIGKITDAIASLPAEVKKATGGMGFRLAVAMNSMINQIPWKLIGQHLGSSFKSILEDLSTFITDVNWQTVGQGIGDLLTNIDWNGILSGMATAVAAATDGGLAMARGFVSSISAGLNDGRLSLNFAVVTATLVNKIMKLLPEAFTIGQRLVNAGLTMATQLVQSIADGFDSSDVVSDMTNVVTSFITNFVKILNGALTFGKTVLTAGARIGLTLIQSISNALVNVKKSGLSTTLANAATNLVKGLLHSVGGLNDNADVMKFLTDLGTAIMEGMGALGSIVGDFTGKLLKYLFSKEGLLDVLNAGVTVGNLIFAGIMQGLTSLSGFLDNMVKSILVKLGVIDAGELKAVEEAGETLADQTAKAFEEAASGNPAFKAGMQTLINWANMRGGQLRSDIEPVAYNLMTAFEGAVKGAAAHSNTGEVFRDAVLKEMFYKNSDYMTRALEENIDLDAEDLDMSAVLEKLQIDPNDILPNFENLNFWEGLLKAVQDGTPSNIMQFVTETLTAALAETNAQIETSAEETAETLSENAQLVEQAYQDITKETKESVGDAIDQVLEESANESGKTGFATALVSGLEPAKEAVAEVSDEVVEQFLKTMSLENGEELGKEYMTGILTGLEVGLDEVVSGLEDYLGITGDGQATFFNGIGIAIAEGIAVGIDRGASVIQAAAEDAAILAYNAACYALGIASPSKLFSEMGGYIMQGWANGMEDDQSLITETINNAAQAASEEAANAEYMFGDSPLVTGLDAVAEKLHEILDTFTALSNTISSMGGLTVPAVASGEYTPYRVRYTAEPGTMLDGGLMTDNFTRNFDETMSDQRDVLRDILQAILNLDLNVDGRTLERSLSTLQRDRIRAYGGG